MIGSALILTTTASAAVIVADCDDTPALPPGGIIPDTYNALRGTVVGACNATVQHVIDFVNKEYDEVVKNCEAQLGPSCPLPP